MCWGGDCIPYIFCGSVNKANFILKIQVQNPHNIKYKGTIQGLKYIWRTEGYRGMFKGNGTNCARIVPNSAVKFFSYEEASKYASADLFFDISLLWSC